MVLEWLNHPFFPAITSYIIRSNTYVFDAIDFHKMRKFLASKLRIIYFMRQNTSATTTIAILRELFAKYRLPVHYQIAPIKLPPTSGRISQHKRLFSHLCDQFQGVFPMSPYRGWHISRKKKGQRIVWRLHLSRHRRESLNHHKEGIDKNVTVNSSDNAENSEKNLSTVKPFFLDGGGRYTVTRRKTCNQRWWLNQNVRTKKKCSLISRNMRPFACDNSKSISSASGSWQVMKSVILKWIRDVGNGNTIVWGKPRFSHR